MIELTLLASLLLSITHSIGICHVQIGIGTELRSSAMRITSDAKEYLLDYLRTKVEGDCETYIIGRK